MKFSNTAFLLGFITVMLSCTTKRTLPLFPIDDSTSKYGFIDSTGKVIIPFRFNYVGAFNNDGLALASIDNSTYGYIDHTGTFIIKPKFKFSPVGINTILYPLRNVNSKQQEFNEAINECSFSNGLALYYDYDKQRFGYINTKGDVVINPVYISASKYKQGYAVVLTSIDTANWEHIKTGIINTKGVMIIPDKYYHLSRMSDGYTSATLITKYGQEYRYSSLVLNWKGNTVGSIMPGYIISTGEFSKGYCKGLNHLNQTLNNTGYFIYDSTGNTLNNSKGEPLMFEDVVIDNGHIVWYKTEGKYHWFILDRDGKGASVIDSRAYERINGGFNKEGLAVVKYNGQYGYIDTFGKFVIEPRYSYARNFNGSLAQAELQNGSLRIKGYINYKGEFVWSTEIRQPGR